MSVAVLLDQFSSLACVKHAQVVLTQPQVVFVQVVPVIVQLAPLQLTVRPVYQGFLCKTQPAHRFVEMDEGSFFNVMMGTM